MTNNQLNPVFADIHEAARKAARGDLRSFDSTARINRTQGVGMPGSTMRKQWDLAYDDEFARIDNEKSAIRLSLGRVI